MEFIAEIGLNHNGSDAILVELIRQAEMAGATYAKFQLGWRYKKNEINYFDQERLELLLKSCEHYGIIPLFTVFNEESYKLLTSIHSPEILKVSSRTTEHDFGFLNELGKKKHKLIISTGMSERSLSKIDHVREKLECECQFVWCVSNYPLYHWEINDFPAEFNNRGFYGISDHSLGNEVAFLAISRGAKIVEKHFTLDKSDTTIRDHALSSTQKEFSELVRIGKALSKISDFI